LDGLRQRIKETKTNEVIVKKRSFADTIDDISEHLIVQSNYMVTERDKVYLEVK
jgi:hypothetical protein